jgi:hypothetical protein
MRILGLLAAGVLVTSLAGVAFAQPPAAFVLQQNAPDPFCPGPGNGGSTTIQFAMPQAANVVLAVWSPDGTTLVRTLVNGSLQAGYHSVTWDGLDEQGAPVVSGAYPYRLTARAPDTGLILFDETVVATVSCPVPGKRTTWGLLRSRFV